MLYSGGCHCGAVRFKVEGNFDEVLACNCSICSKKGYLLGFAPAASFKLEQGEDALSDYQFGKKNIHHQFCKICGIGAFGRGTGPDGSSMAAINVRCLDDIDISKLKIKAFDGKHLL